MKVGIWCIGWGGITSKPAWITEAAQTPERLGFSTIWTGEDFLYEVAASIPSRLPVVESW